MILGLINIDLDIPEIDELEAQMDSTIDQGLQELAEEIEWEWRASAKSLLRDSNTGVTGNKYLEGFGVEVVGKEIQVVLKGLGAGLELGQEAYDLKPGYLRKAKIGPSGIPYRIIPMGHRSTEVPPPRFRTVTAMSKGWIHPGFGGPPVQKRMKKHTDVSDAVKDKIDKELVPAVFDKLFGSGTI